MVSYDDRKAHEGLNYKAFRAFTFILFVLVLPSITVCYQPLPTKNRPKKTIRGFAGLISIETDLAPESKDLYAENRCLLLNHIPPVRKSLHCFL
jgi:hypothetical protein